MKEQNMNQCETMQSRIRAYTELRQRQLEQAMAGNIRESAKYAERIRQLADERLHECQCAGVA